MGVLYDFIETERPDGIERFFAFNYVGDLWCHCHATSRRERGKLRQHKVLSENDLIVPWANRIHINHTFACNTRLVCCLMPVLGI